MFRFKEEHDENRLQIDKFSKKLLRFAFFGDVGPTISNLDFKFISPSTIFNCLCFDMKPRDLQMTRPTELKLELLLRPTRTSCDSEL